MAKLVYGLNQSLDGFIDHTLFDPTPRLFSHFIDAAQHEAGRLYGRTMYEVMRYWDDDQPEWEPAEHEFAAAWRAQPKWVVSRTLDSVGPNATLVRENLEGLVRRLKSEYDGEVEVAGPRLANSITEMGLIDEYVIYLHPIVAGHGKPFFTGARPSLRLAATDEVDDGVLRLTYVPA
jgi:dihydrofolate reductase